MRLAIVIVAYNRPQALARLLKSVKQAHYHTNVDIIISIDNGEQEQEVAGVANNFDWHRGSKEVVQHNHHMGLKQHMLIAGKLAKSYDAFVLLEDDLVVSPEYFSYIHQALPYYMDSADIVGVSLYHQHYHHALLLPFYPLADDSDVYFMQYPSSWGAIYLADQWEAFATWIEGQNDSVLDVLPHNIKGWPQSSWKKWMAAYLVHQQKYYVFPRTSLTTNMGNEGAHHKQENNYLQAPLQYGKRDYKFTPLTDSKAVYDVYMEAMPKVFKLDKDVEVDLYGLKSSYNKPFVLTTKKVKQAVKQWGLNLKPIELNIVLDNQGEVISLAKTEDVINEQLDHKEWLKYNYIIPAGSELLSLLAEKIKKKLK